MRKRRRFRRKKDKFKKLKTIMISCGLIMICLFVFGSNYIMNKKLEEYKSKESEVMAQLEGEISRTQEIADYKKYTETIGFVEDVAREKLHLVYPDEIVFLEKE